MLTGEKETIMASIHPAGGRRCCLPPSVRLGPEGTREEGERESESQAGWLPVWRRPSSLSTYVNNDNRRTGQEM